MYKTVLLPVDLDQESSWRASLPAAVEFCRASGGNLHILTVVPDFGMTIVGQFFKEGFEKEMADRVLERLHQFVDTNVPDDVKVQHIVAGGTIYEVILNIAGKINADVIVMEAHRPELKDYLLGPNAARVVRHANCSVLVVRE